MALANYLATTYNALLPEAGLEREHNLAYGDHDRQTLDVYRPTGARDGLKSVVVFLYGGSWDSGDKDMYYFVARSLVDRGYVVIVPNYRLYPEVQFPAFLEDSASAVHWVSHHAGDFGGDPDRLFVIGHSAGAYNAAMVAYDNRYLDAFGSFRGTIRGCIGLSGLYNFLPIKDEKLKRIFASARDPHRTQPVHMVGPGGPPGLFVSSDYDGTVHPKNSRDMAEALREAGIESRLLYLEPALKRTGHFETVMSLGPGFSSRYPTLDAVDEFVTRWSDQPVRSGPSSMSS